MYEKFKKSKTFCMYPFTHLNFKSDGKTAPCFRSKPTSKITASDAGWNSSKIKALRRKLVQGIYSEECQNCWNLEQANVQSYRQVSIDENSYFLDWIKSLNSYDQTTGTMNTGPKQIEVRFSNQCNLECRMCGPLYSSKWEARLKNNPEMDKKLKILNVNYSERKVQKKFKDDFFAKRLLGNILEMGKDLEHILIAGGEPLLQREHWDLLSQLKPYSSKIKLDYSTNLTFIKFEKESMIEQWRNFREIRLKVSLDGDPFIYPYIRRGSCVKSVEANIRLIQKSSLENIIMRGSMTVSLYNIERVRETVEYITRLGLFFHASFVQEPEILSIQALPKRRKEFIFRDLNDFMMSLDHYLENSFKHHSFWETKQRRTKQIFYVKKYLKEICDFMTERDDSHLFVDFLEYDFTIGESTGQTIIDFMPQWKPLLPNKSLKKLRKLFNCFTNRLTS